MSLLLDVITAKRLFEKNTRREVNLVALAVVISTALTYVFYIVNAFVLPLISELIIYILVNMGQSRIYASAFAENFIGSEELAWFLSIVSSILCTFLPFAILSKGVLRMTSEEAAPLKGKILKSFPFVYCSALMTAVAVSSLVSNLFSVLFPAAYEMSTTEVTEIYGTSTSASSLILAFLSMCVIAPLTEEFVYRGVIYGYLKRYGSYFAAFSSALIFGLAHATVDQIAYAFIFGLMLCEVTKRTGNLKTAIIIHFINNLVTYTVGYLVPYLGIGDAAVIFELAYSIIVGVFAIIGFIMLFRNKNSEKTSDDGEICEVNASVRCFFCMGTVLVIISSVINVVLGLFANG